ncbi:hypothetical protein I316_05025 [Kwoniella heveanensis BCC8398]|uniref:SET domain-containing protein n=1 Tax=Kwoniella heveanensis BCC8398 TaxID=1296120 RepID=A0A1B9GQA4_9TREE|nr:hypothetical protein I316_05025 [Kwoniella heveanensis BCC8398]
MTAQEEGVDQVVIGANKVQMTDGNGAEAAGLNGLEEGGRVADLTSSSRTTSAHAGLPLSHTNVSTASTTRADDLTNEQHTSASPADSSPNHEDPSYSTSTSSVSLTSDATADTEPHPMNPLNLHLLSHPHRGRGVFAPASIPAGTLIEESPVLVITKEEWDRGRMNDCVLGSYGFCWSNGGMAIGLGLASLFNHSSSPNVNFIRSTSNGTIKFLTSRRVEKGEELCICYIADESKLWFVPADQKQKQKQKQKQGRRRRRKNDHNGGCEDMSESESGPESESAGSSSDSSSDVDLGEAIDVEDLVDQDVLEAQKRRERRLAQARKAGTGLPNGNGRHRMTGRKFAPCCSSSSASSSSAQANVEIRSPRPVRVTESGSIPPSASASASASRSSTPSTSSTPTPAYPTASTLNSSLPTPLHSESATVATGRRHANRQPAELVEDLDWREEDWVNSKGKEKEQSRAGASSGEVVRVKGPAEREVDEDEREMMEIWIMEFTDPKLTRVALDFSKELSNADDRLKHLKRVCRKKVNDHEVVRIVLHLVSEYDAPTLHRLMTEFSPSLSALQPVRYTVPRLSARTQAQLKWKLHIWPVSYSPAQMIPSSSVHWPVGRKAWVTAGIKRVLSLALDAKRKGEVPVATFVTAFPSAYWPKEDGFIPPTDNLRASSHDTRVSESHPLRHAALNCIASIAHLRTIPPFSDVPPTRNGADYLLTSLTMFISHEPCVMCCMALLHSRVREVFYVFSRKNGGGFEYEPKRVQLDSAPSPSTSTSSTGDMPQGGKENGQEGNEVQSENNGHGYGIHARRDLNHRFEAWRWDGEVDEEMRKALEVDEQLQL